MKNGSDNVLIDAILDVYDDLTKSAYGRTFYELCMNSKFYITDKKKSILPPRIIHQERQDYGYTLEVKLPLGIDFSDLRDTKGLIEEAFKAEVEIEKKDYKSYIHVLTGELKESIPYSLDVIEQLQNYKLAFPVGISRKGPLFLDFFSPSSHHTLIGGASGFGKSSCLRQALASMCLAYGPDYLQLHLVDFKEVELNSFANVPHCSEFATDNANLRKVLKGLIAELERRKKLFAGESCVDLDGYEAKTKSVLPRKLFIVDEYADVEKKLQDDVYTLLRKGRFVGIFVILCTQRPTIDVIPGALKALCPATISFRTRNKLNSVVLLEHGAAGELPGIAGRGIVQTPGYEMQLQVPFMTKEQLELICAYLREELEWGELERQL